MSEAKTRPTGASVQDFLGAIADAGRREDCLAVAAWMQEATGAAPEMWGDGIVGFGRYLLRYADGREAEWPLIGFSPRKQELVLYLMSGFHGHDALLSRLGRHRTGKSCLYVKRLSDVDTAVLRKMIAGSVAAMAARRTA